MTVTPERIAALRSAIASDAYAPDPGEVAESVIAWIARPERFDQFKPKPQKVEALTEHTERRPAGGAGA